ncbi:hypothetical protein ACFL6U_02935 [Planctomycetota bacterium]
MKNTDLGECAREIVTIITAQLAQDLVKNRFDEPIAQVAGQFECRADCPVTHKAFHKVIAEFVERIYAKALKSLWMLTDPLAEAIFLLENHYRSDRYGTGYTAAILDADDASVGSIRSVLTGLAEAIKDIEREKYIQGVFARYLYGGDWFLRCEIVRILLDDYQPFIPEQLSQCAPAYLVDEIPSILCRYISSDSVLQQISFCHEKP